MQNLFKQVVYLLSISLLLSPIELKAANFINKQVDTSIYTTIKDQLSKHKGELYYPASVRRFYQQEGFKLAWVLPDTVKTHAWDAMMLLDCVNQYGLIHNDYHPGQLLYEKLHGLIEQNQSDDQKALFDIMLTDAMIRFMNNLHYGKLNPVYTAAKIDLGVSFKADKELLTGLQSQNFPEAINSAQPKVKLYTDLQYHLHLLVGLRSGDCYVIPEALVRKMAINMERLRWIGTTGKKVHLTCIVKEGAVINYKDIYKQDSNLEKALYNEKHFIKREMPLNRKIILKVEK
jgi:murein L,D-transpeptidase YcbB/YkuD